PDFEPDDAEERAELDEAAVAFAERCQRLDGDLLPHLSTDAVIDDLDLLRQALGDEKLSYLGLSYGTLIGLRYAEAYPDRVGRLILDSVVDPASTLADLLAQQADGFDRVFAEADEACQASDSCPDGGLAATYDRVAERLDESAIDGIGPTELSIGTLISLYDESLWSRYVQALSDADNGDVAGIRTFYGFYAGAADEAAYLAVVCTDSPVPVGAVGWDRLADQLIERSPRFGAALANEVRPCAHWPVRDTTAPESVTTDTTEGLPPILVLSTLGDAATPVENAVNVAAGLDGATLVTVDDTSHIAYGRNFCVNEIVADYLATGELPEAIQRC
ncbi:MAG: alpha/beta hydrolase, partial [Actinomycetota bacterium]